MNNNKKKKNTIRLFSDDIIAHYGIEGQKWGVRNYQYEDGTLTPEGIERYRKNNYEGLKKSVEKKGTGFFNNEINKYVNKKFSENLHPFKFRDIDEVHNNIKKILDDDFGHYKNKIIETKKYKGTVANLLGNKIYKMYNANVRANTAVDLFDKIGAKTVIAI